MNGLAQSSVCLNTLKGLSSSHSSEVQVSASLSFEGLRGDFYPAMGWNEELSSTIIVFCCRHSDLDLGLYSFPIPHSKSICLLVKADSVH